MFNQGEALKIAITGAAGLFGRGLHLALESEHEVVPLSHADLEITNSAGVRSVLARIKPDLVVHTAALPDIDYCETHPDEAHRVNVEGTQHVATATAAVGAGLVHISTDAVFDGKKAAPYLETDTTNPISVYGRSKLDAELAVQEYERHWIFRVSVLFGPGKANFVSKTVARVRTGQKHLVASDQLGSATYTLDAASKILEVVKAKKYGLYHLCNLGPCTRMKLAEQAVVDVGMNPEMIEGVPGETMGRPGPRLKYAVMEMHALREAGFESPRPWQDALKEYLAKYQS
jgi:dTDP-4-dehydrorhamnose reductase